MEQLWILEKAINRYKEGSLDADYIVYIDIKSGSRTAATSKMERFVAIVNGFQPLTIITKRSILDVAAVLDPPLDITETPDMQQQSDDVMKFNSKTEEENM